MLQLQFAGSSLVLKISWVYLRWPLILIFSSTGSSICFVFFPSWSLALSLRKWTEPNRYLPRDCFCISYETLFESSLICLFLNFLFCFHLFFSDTYCSQSGKVYHFFVSLSSMCVCACVYTVFTLYLKSTTPSLCTHKLR